jgi:pilus assembly protein Flp/PilA
LKPRNFNGNSPPLKLFPGFRTGLLTANFDYENSPMAGGIMRHFLSQFWKETRAQDLVEYSLAAGMVALAVVAAIPHLTGVINNVFSRIGSLVNSTIT